MQRLPHVAGSMLLAHALPHAWNPALHVKWQLLCVHDTCPLSTLGHALPHCPQFPTLVVRFTHCVPQSVGACGWQPLTHANPPDVGAHNGAAAPQTELQLPQWDACDRSVSHPSAAFWLQSAYPALHVPTAHEPPAHTAVARGRAQAEHELAPQP